VPFVHCCPVLTHKNDDNGHLFDLLTGRERSAATNASSGVPRP